MLTGLTIFFSITTIAVIAYPLFKLMPSWRERVAYRKAAKSPGIALGTPVATQVDDAA